MSCLAPSVSRIDSGYTTTQTRKIQILKLMYSKNVFARIMQFMIYIHFLNTLLGIP